MKKKIIVIKNICVFSILIIAIIFFIWSLVYKKNIRETNIVSNLQKVDEIVINDNKILEEHIPKRIFPTDIDGFEIVGKLEIPEINLNTYILSETNDNSLKKSVTKLCGPKINEVGNFCILGHNYNKTKMFENLKKLEINDSIFLTNLYGYKVEYKIYEIYKVYPDEVECLEQETYGDREVTLITCTTGAIKRLVLKATEVYD